MAPLTRRSYLRDIRFTQRKVLCAQLDNRDDWRDMIGYIKRSDDTGLPRYEHDHIVAFSQESRRFRGSPSSSLLSDWCTQLPTIDDLLEVLKEARLYDTANYVVTEILSEGPLRIPLEHDEISHGRSHNAFQTAPVPFVPPTSPMPPLDYPSIVDEDTKRSIEEQCYSNGMKVFSYAELFEITAEFDERPLVDGGRLIGEGGYGKVFFAKSSRDQSEMWAIKRFRVDGTSSDRQVEFFKELSLDCHHDNVLSIIGVCHEHCFCIIYEYMSNGSLEQLMKGKITLTAEERLNIAIGIARGINHLHTFRPKPVIHRDIKSANILLDSKLIPKVGDFGLARTLNQRTGTFTTTVKGTQAYMPPEALEGIVKTAWDVFSFGVVLLELITGLEPFVIIKPGKDPVRLISALYDEDEFDGDRMEFVDKDANWNTNVAQQLFDIVHKCQKKYARRPEMNEILNTLIHIQGEMNE